MMSEKQLIRLAIGFVIGFVGFRPLAMVLAYKIDNWWEDRRIRKRNEEYGDTVRFWSDKMDKMREEGFAAEAAPGSGMSGPSAEK
jgi:hypothetical protein